MTTETQQAPEAQSEEEQSFLPTVLVGAGILAVAALLIFWPSDDAARGGNGAGAAGNEAGAAAGANAGGPRGRAAGVGSRPVDAATRPEAAGRRNPAIKLPAGAHGMAPVPEPQPKDPPATATVDEKIAFYEKRLVQAERMLDNRKKFAERLTARQARIESAPDSDERLKEFEKRKAIVEDNYEKAKSDVEEIEGKLAELRGS